MKKNVLIGITGSIAAYKTACLIRFFKKNGCEVKTVASEAGLLFIGEKTLEALSNNPVYHDTFQKKSETKHISLADWADIFVIAPLSANTASKIANGIADNLICSIACAYLGRNKPFFMAPAMNDGMWKNPFVQENIQKLKNKGVKIIEPVEGELACGTVGIGKMKEPDKIFEIVSKSAVKKNCGKVLVTAGGTREYIDPIRFITNASSGKMGIAIADCAYDMGFETVLISTVETEKPYKVISVSTAEEMKKAAIEEFHNSDYLF
ncbi:MAG: bifunctional phosphopantothenoylcysteine decarboxylase/phosphopantothenate--cysteine ligase CoaBC, partial [Candidatus Gastranaerophilales bacterium]|nr:bifunctional phosphopantothenoylcysteine decarboxylase/phosphopantothenate--cysteine ligase CoaBC [Candidatus Gastranaerophilales bacterium]